MLEPLEGVGQQHYGFIPMYLVVSPLRCSLRIGLALNAPEEENTLIIFEHTEEDYLNKKSRYSFTIPPGHYHFEGTRHGSKGMYQARLSQLGWATIVWLFLGYSYYITLEIVIE